MNGKQHHQIRAAAGAIYTVAKCFIQKFRDSTAEFSYGKITYNTTIGYVTGIISDLLEPTLNSHHCKFFHSATATGAAATYETFGKHTEEWDNTVKKPIQAAAIAYVLQLAADATTQLGTLRNQHTDASYGTMMTKLEQTPEEITEATSLCLITITEQIDLFPPRVLQDEHSQREPSKTILLNHRIEFNEVFDEENDSIEIASYGLYNASEILYSVNLNTYRTGNLLSRN